MLLPPLCGILWRLIGHRQLLPGASTIICCPGSLVLILKEIKFSPGRHVRAQCHFPAVTWLLTGKMHFCCLFTRLETALLQVRVNDMALPKRWLPAANHLSGAGHLSEAILGETAIRWGHAWRRLSLGSAARVIWSQANFLMHSFSRLWIRR